MTTSATSTPAKPDSIISEKLAAAGFTPEDIAETMLQSERIAEEARRREAAEIAARDTADREKSRSRAIIEDREISKIKMRPDEHMLFIHELITERLEQLEELRELVAAGDVKRIKNALVGGALVPFDPIRQNIEHLNTGKLVSDGSGSQRVVKEYRPDRSTARRLRRRVQLELAERGPRDKQRRFYEQLARALQISAEPSEAD
jgi:uncharacterized protein Smg (DUF494 family)